MGLKCQNFLQTSYANHTCGSYGHVIVSEISKKIKLFMNYNQVQLSNTSLQAMDLPKSSWKKSRHFLPYMRAYMRTWASPCKPINDSNARFPNHSSFRVSLISFIISSTY